MLKELALVGLNNSHPFLFGGLVNGGVREKFVANSPQWTHKLFPDQDWSGAYSDRWRFTRAWSRDMDFAARVAEAVKVDKLSRTLAQAARETSAAFVCDMWGEYHREQALAFLELGKPVFVDKPLAETVADAEAMIQAAKAHRTVLSTCSSLRFDTAIRNLKKSLADRLGPPEIITVCCPCHQDLARYTVHGLEIMLEIAGDRKVARVRNIGTSQRRHLILLEFEDGLCGVIHSWENHAYSVTVTAREGQEVVRPGVEDSTGEMVGAVLASFECGVPVVPYENVLEVIRVIEAAAASRASGGMSVEPVTR